MIFLKCTYVPNIARATPYTEKLSAVYVKFKCNGLSYILSGKTRYGS